MKLTCYPSAALVDAVLKGARAGDAPAAQAEQPSE
jgi:hypothetical protein